MNLIQNNKKQKTKAYSFFIVNILFFFAFFIFSSFLHLFNNQISYLFVLVIIFVYALCNLRSSYLYFEQKSTYMLFIISIIMGISRLIYSLYLLSLPFIDDFSIIFQAAINLYIYLLPYIIAFSILLTCKYFSNKTTLRRAFTYFILGIFLVGGAIFILVPYNSFYISLSKISVFIRSSIITAFYVISIIYLKKAIELIGKQLFLSLSTLFILITISEIIMSLNHNILNTFLYIAITFPLYFLYTAKVQHSLLSADEFLLTQQRLYRLNMDLMNKFFTFKSAEVENLRAESHVKDGIYKKLFDFAPDAFLICDKNNISYVNQATLSLLDTKDEKNILNTSLLDFIHPDSVSLVESMYEKFSKTNIITSEIQIITLENNIKDVRFSSTILQLEQHTYTIVSLHDLASYKANQLIQLQLEENVATEKSKVEFFANISHDLKTPINVIYNATQLQDVCAKGHEYDKVHMYNHIIKQNCLRLQKLLNDLLDITKLDANCFQAKPRLCDIIYVIEGITQSVISYMEQKNISMIFDTNVEEKLAFTDPDLIERILLNLISNAIKYGRDNGHIWITLFDDGKYLTVSVKDNGIGIPKSQVPFVFERFHKVASNLSTSSNGNGIGLSLVKSIVDILGGSIKCLSTEGAGSEFIVRLPMITYKEEYNTSQIMDAFLFGGNNNLNVELSDT